MTNGTKEGRTRAEPGLAPAPRSQGPSARSELTSSGAGPRSAALGPSARLSLPPHLPTEGGGFVWLEAERGRDPLACGRLPGRLRVAASGTHGWCVPRECALLGVPRQGSGSPPRPRREPRTARARPRARGPRRPPGGDTDFPEGSRSPGESARELGGAGAPPWVR